MTPPLGQFRFESILADRAVNWMLLWLFVFARIVANPFSNVFQKLLTHRGGDPLCVICITHGLLSLACIPFLLTVPMAMSMDFWLNMVLCAFLCVAGNVLIVQALERSDLSVLGPISAYKAVISLVPGMVLLNEFPAWPGLGGKLLIVSGSYFLVDQQGHESGPLALRRFFKDPGIQLRLAALVVSALEAVFLKRALQASGSLMTFVWWCVLGFAVSLVAVVLTLRSGAVRRQLGVAANNPCFCLALFATTGLMQLSTILVLAGMQVGYALLLFQTSTLVSVILGYKLFQEKHFLKRMCGSSIMVAGAILIIIGR